MILYYTGVGSRHTPKIIRNAMTMVAESLQHSFCLRSGGADGADTAFEKGVTNGNKEIYLPWRGFNGSDSSMYGVCDAAKDLAMEVHNLKRALAEQPAALKLHARNCYQVLGADLNTPSTFLLCYTEDAKLRGGTATAIKLATMHGIPVLNYGRMVDKSESQIFDVTMTWLYTKGIEDGND